MLLREVELRFVDRRGADPRELLEDHVDARLNVARRGSGVDAEESGGAIGGLKRVDAVDEPALLANLLKEPARHASAEHRVEYRERIAAFVADVDAASTDDSARACLNAARLTAGVLSRTVRLAETGGPADVVRPALAGFSRRRDLAATSTLTRE